SPDNRYLLTGAGDAYRTWRVGSWRLEKSLTRRREDGYLTAVAMAFSADGSLLAVVPRPGEIELRDFARQRPPAPLIAPGQPCLGGMTFSADGSRLAACESRTLHLWDLRRLRRELAALGLDWDQPAFP